MNTREDVLQLLDRFYHLCLKERLHDAKIDAEWNWFTSRLRDTGFQRQQAEQYLDGLERSRRLSEHTNRNVGLSPNNRDQLNSRRILESSLQANILLNSNPQLKHKSNSNKEDISYRGALMLPATQPKLDKRYSERVDTETRLLNTSTSRNAQKENLLSSAGTVASGTTNTNRFVSPLQNLLKVFEETQMGLK